MNLKELLEAMSELEARIAVIYEHFATTFRDAADVGDLWVSMSREELQHAELLSHEAGTVGDMVVRPEWNEAVQKLQGIVAQCEREQQRIGTLQGALGMTADLEDAEAEHLHGVLSRLGGSPGAWADNPAMQHQLRGLLEHAVRVFGTPALQSRLTWRRFAD